MKCKLVQGWQGSGREASECGRSQRGRRWSELRTLTLQRLKTHEFMKGDEFEALKRERGGRCEQGQVRECGPFVKEDPKLAPLDLRWPEGET